VAAINIYSWKAELFCKIEIMSSQKNVTLSPPPHLKKNNFKIKKNLRLKKQKNLKIKKGLENRETKF